MTTRRPIVGGNWKMNTDRAGGVALAQAVAAGTEDLGSRCDVCVIPPAPYLDAVGAAIRGRGLELGAQNVHFEPSGAFTGEVSTGLLLDLGVSHVVIGHSERRHVFGEDDALINRKVASALAADLAVILCIGETEAERDAGAAERINLDQLARGLDGVAADDLARITIAYEPVWAIGTGRTASEADVAQMHAVIRGAIAERYGDAHGAQIRIMYGGSVKPANAAGLIAIDDVDGFLVGGASLVADDFLQIIRAAASTSLHEARNV